MVRERVIRLSKYIIQCSSCKAAVLLIINLLIAILFTVSAFASGGETVDQSCSASNDWAPLYGTNKMGQVFQTGKQVSKITKIKINALKHGTIGNLKLSLYAWTQDYASTVAQQPLKVVESAGTTNYHEFALDVDVTPATPYFLELNIADQTGDAETNFYYVWENHGGTGYQNVMGYDTEFANSNATLSSDLVFWTYCPEEQKPTAVDQSCPSSNDWAPLSGSYKLGQMFLTGQRVTKITKIKINALKHGVIGNLKLSLYAWTQDYASTVAQQPLRAVESSGTTNYHEFALDVDVMPATPYFLELSIADQTGDAVPSKQGTNFYYVWEKHDGSGYTNTAGYDRETKYNGQATTYSDLVFWTYCPEEQAIPWNEPWLKSWGSNRITFLCLSSSDAQNMMDEGAPPLVMNTDVVAIYTLGINSNLCKAIVAFFHQYGIRVCLLARSGGGLAIGEFPGQQDPCHYYNETDKATISSNVSSYVSSTGADGIIFDEPASGAYNATAYTNFSRTQVLNEFRVYVQSSADQAEISTICLENGIADISQLTVPTPEDVSAEVKQLTCYFFSKFRVHLLDAYMKICWDAAKSANPNSFNIVNVSPYALWQGKLEGPPDLHEILSYQSLDALCFDCYEAYSSGTSSISPQDAHFYYSWGENLSQHYSKRFISISSPHYHRAPSVNSTWADALFSGFRAGTDVGIWNWRWLLQDAWRSKLDQQYAFQSENAFEAVHQVKAEERKADFALVFPINVFYHGNPLSFLRYTPWIGNFSRTLLESVYDYDILDSSFLATSEINKYKGLIIWGGYNTEDEINGVKSFLGLTNKFLYLITASGGYLGDTDVYGRTMTPDASLIPYHFYTPQEINATPNLIYNALNQHPDVSVYPVVVRKYATSVIVFNRSDEEKNAQIVMPAGVYTILCAFDDKFDNIANPSYSLSNLGEQTIITITLPAKAHVILSQ